MVDSGADIELGQLAPVLADLGTAAPLGVTPLHGGSSRVFRIDLANGEALVLKAYERDFVLPRKEAYASSLLAGLDMPFTRFLSLDETCSRLPFRFAITNYLPGVSVDALKAEPDVADLYRQMGGMLRQLHSVRMPGYGRFDATGLAAPYASNTEFVTDLAQGALGRFRRHGADAALAQRLEAIVVEQLPRIVHSTGAVFAHDDFQPHNVLAERGGDGRLRLTGLVDFGNARAADPVFDLAKALFCSEHDAPGSSPHIRAGYGPIDHPDPAAALWLYTLLHRASMWSWLRSIGVIPDGAEHDLIADLRAMATSGTYTT